MAEHTNRKPRPHDCEEFDEHMFVHESLIEVSDLLGEALAEAAISHHGAERISEINVLIWKLRWELGMTGGHAVSLADVESEAAE